MANETIEVEEINKDIADLLSEIFEDTEAHYKISISVEAGHNVTIKYDDMDEEWCHELVELCRLLTQRAPDLLGSPACCASFVFDGTHHKDCRFAQPASG